MFRVEYENKLSLNKVKTAYQELFSKDFDTPWNSLVMKYPDMAKALPKGMKASDLLTAPFEKLVDVYFRFEKVKKKLSGKEIEDRKNLAEKIFSYSSYSKKIAKFFMDATYGFEVYNCYYCELENIRAYVDDQGITRHLFEIEHVLDKGTCPMLSLSLFNFVPSCGHCNRQDVKGNHTIGDTVSEIKRLSPTVGSYDFEHKVIFVINAQQSQFSDLRMTDHPDDFEISFFYLDPLYKKSVDLFKLHARYNGEPYKSQLLNIREKRNNYPDNAISEIAKISHRSYDEVMKELFEIDVCEKNHWPMNKAKHDVVINCFMPVIP